MYAYLFFILVIIGIFLIFENIKEGKKISFFKKHVLVFLVAVSLMNGIDFLIEIGYSITLYASIVRLFIIIVCVNIFYILANHTIPKRVVYFEIVIFILYLISLLKGFQFIAVKNGIIVSKITPFFILNYFPLAVLIIPSMIYNLYKIYKNTDPENLYQVKIKRWTSFLVLFIAFIIISILTAALIQVGLISPFEYDSRLIKFFTRLLFILFLFFRPKFIDEYSFAIVTKNKISKQKISTENFDFLFYTNHYYLNSEANLEDFALKLNHNKAEVLAFLKSQTNDNFNELLNRNRITYFKELLSAKKHESFTIEALSEMSGFNNKRTMYNAFKKYDGGSPTSYISSLS